MYGICRWKRAICMKMGWENYIHSFRNTDEFIRDNPSQQCHPCSLNLKLSKYLFHLFSLCQFIHQLVKITYLFGYRVSISSTR
jgi:hypothetical protein